VSCLLDELLALSVMSHCVRLAPIIFLLRSSIILSSLFFLLIPLPPISTLFPYTTLFRSRWFPHLPGRGRRFGKDVTPLNCERQLDRKSTRLNSSHQIISYAVFCLKKKMH